MSSEINLPPNGISPVKQPEPVPSSEEKLPPPPEDKLTQASPAPLWHEFISGQTFTITPDALNPTSTKESREAELKERFQKAVANILGNRDKA